MERSPLRLPDRRTPEIRETEPGAFVLELRRTPPWLAEELSLLLRLRAVDRDRAEGRAPVHEEVRQRACDIAVLEAGNVSDITPFHRQNSRLSPLGEMLPDRNPRVIVMDSEAPERVSIDLVGFSRFVCGGLGFAFIGVPIAVYFDLRRGLIGPPADAWGGFDLVLAIFVVLGGVFLLSAILGKWLMWKDVQVLDESAPNPGQTTAVPGRKKSPTASLEQEAPPFEGRFVGPLPLDEADSRFVDVAERYLHDELQQRKPLTASVETVYRSAGKGRPNWYFQVTTDEGETKWIRVPHAGRGGAGAGPAGENN